MAKQQVTTPKGELEWVFIDGDGSFNELSEKYEYKATLVMPADDPEAQAFKQKLDDMWERCPERQQYEKAYAEAKPAIQAKFELHRGYKLQEDEDGNPTGKIEFRFKTNTTFSTKKGGEKPTVITVYNAAAKKVSLGDTKVGNGTIGRLSGTAMTWFKGMAGGVSLYLKSIQIINLVEYVENEFTEEADGDFNEADGSNNEFTGVPQNTSTEEPSDDAGV